MNGWWIFVIVLVILIAWKVGVFGALAG